VSDEPGSDGAAEDELVPGAPLATGDGDRTETFRARPADIGRRVEKLLARCLPSATWSHVARLLRQGRVVTEGGQVLRAGDALRGDEVVHVRRPGRASETAPQPNRRLWLDVVHEDPDVLVVNKPSGLTMHPGPGHGTDTLLNVLVGRRPDLLALGAARGWGLVHRLDRDTSGLVLVARTPLAYDALTAAFAARKVDKTYLALVSGRPDPQSGEVSTPVDDKDALTRYETLASTPGPRFVSLVAAHPVTGRMHQIRVHLASRGCPVLGDERHGGADTPRAPRLALHAHRLAFDHPVGGARLSFERPLPRDLRRAWKRLGGPAVAQASGAGPEAEGET
jgi:23S rRNA pseudouridine1911/1915/1917 synthase